MKGVFEFLDDLPAGAVKGEILNLVRTEGVVAAVRAAIDVLGDHKAPAAARATMAALMFRLAGYLEKPTEDEDVKPTMTAEQWQDAVRKLDADRERLEKRLERLRRENAQIDAEDDIFA